LRGKTAKPQFKSNITNTHCNKTPNFFFAFLFCLQSLSTLNQLVQADSALTELLSDPDLIATVFAPSNFAFRYAFAS
jgi:uncharacterized surface protein with fasciclin (FAS1) repeats